MKLKNEQEINTLGKESWDEWKSEDDFELDGDYYQDGYANGYSQAQQDLLASARESFEEWWESDNDIPEILGRAAILSQAKEIEELKKEIQEMREKDAEISSLKKDLIYLLKGVAYFRPDMKVECEDIKVRHNLNKGENK